MNLRPVASPAAVFVLIVAPAVAHYVVPESWLAAAFTAVVVGLISLGVRWASSRGRRTRPS